MVRCASIALLLAFLIALTFLWGTPGANSAVSNGHAGVACWSSGSTSASIALGGFSTDSPDAAFSQPADDDSHDLPIACGVAELIWPNAALDLPILRSSDCAGPNYWPCAASPRAPPTA